MASGNVPGKWGSRGVKRRYLELKHMVSIVLLRQFINKIIVLPTYFWHEMSYSWIEQWLLCSIFMSCPLSYSSKTSVKITKYHRQSQPSKMARNYILTRYWCVYVKDFLLARDYSPTPTHFYRQNNVLLTFWQLIWAVVYWINVSKPTGQIAKAFLIIK